MVALVGSAVDGDGRWPSFAGCDPGTGVAGRVELVVLGVVVVVVGGVAVGIALSWWWFGPRTRIRSLDEGVVGVVGGDGMVVGGCWGRVVGVGLRSGDGTVGRRASRG